MTIEELERLVAKTIALYEKETRHAATATREMIQNLGVVETLSRLVISGTLQQGFKVLRDRGLLNQTFEHIVVHNQPFFKPDVINAAQWRLDNAFNLH